MLVSLTEVESIHIQDSTGDSASEQNPGFRQSKVLYSPGERDYVVQRFPFQIRIASLWYICQEVVCEHIDVKLPAAILVATITNGVFVLSYNFCKFGHRFKKLIAIDLKQIFVTHHIKVCYRYILGFFI